MLEICQSCLKADDSVHPMSAEDVKNYYFATKVQTSLSSCICTYCECLLRKLTKFIRQCIRSEELLRTEHKQISSLPSVVQLSISDTKNYYLGPEEVVAGIKDEGSFIEEDDIPLVFLNEHYACEDDDIEGQSDVKLEKDDYKIAERKKIKKDVKEGFSSRMVTETEEYVVIKLTKEQILEEMHQQSMTEKYKVLPYKCDKCVRGFNFEDVLRKHMEKHDSKNGPFQCELCTQYCPTKVSLRGHLKSHSTRYKCKLCGIVRLSRQHVLEHYSLEHTHTATVYKCPQCEHTTNKRTAMQRHVRLHSKCEPVKCDLCGKTYKSKESLRIHIMRHDEQKLHQCEFCSSSFVYAAQLRKHIRSVHENKDYYCVECDIMFKSMDNLKQHLQRAKRHRDSSSYKYTCPQCPERFISQSTLATHRTNAHGAAKSESCSVCARKYSSLEALRWHTRRCHTTEHTRIKCDVCDRSFSRAYVLRVHMRTHTGERPHMCECGATFTQAAGLRAHVVARHKK
nr:zinc finger protein 782-like [Danaus plexippus plexippus]